MTERKGQEKENFEEEEEEEDKKNNKSFGDQRIRERKKKNLSE